MWTPAPTPAGDRKAPTGICAVFPNLCPPAPALQPAPTPAPGAPSPNLKLPDSLFKPSTGKLMTFYMYRVQNNDNYPQPNHDMLNLAGAMWYLHNEVIWHPKGRSGTYFAKPVTRILKFKVQVRATQPLIDLGMNFGVFNAFDSGKCTGPFECDNFPKAGFTVGCETWQPGAGSNFPHAQWNKLNHYKGAIWYSLPGPCPSQTYAKKSKECIKEAPGGECPKGVTPTGTYNCTYTLEQLGEITIDELEGIDSVDKFVASGGREYDPKSDKGVHMDFWDGLQDTAACARRVQHAEDLFHRKYPGQPRLERPPCDFNRFTFYPDRKT